MAYILTQDEKSCDDDEEEEEEQEEQDDGDDNDDDDDGDVDKDDGNVEIGGEITYWFGPGLSNPLKC